MPMLAAVKTKLEPVQTNDLDAWEEANIQTPGCIKNTPTPRDPTYSIEKLKTIRESCNLDPLDSWPAFEVVKAVSTPRGNSPR